MDDKQTLRNAIRRARSARVDPARGAFATELERLVRDAGATTVLSFVGVTGEPDTSGFHEWALHHGVRVFLPSSLPNGELAWAQFNEAPLVGGLFGIPEPVGERVPTPELRGIDLILAPAAAVDAHGTRLGWGRGYYDRALEELRRHDDPPEVFAVVFADEVYAQLPSEPHDESVTGVVTELGITRFE